MAIIALILTVIVFFALLINGQQIVKITFGGIAILLGIYFFVRFVILDFTLSDGLFGPLF